MEYEIVFTSSECAQASPLEAFHHHCFKAHESSQSAAAMATNATRAHLHIASPHNLPTADRTARAAVLTVV